MDFVPIDDLLTLYFSPPCACPFMLILFILLENFAVKRYLFIPLSLSWSFDYKLTLFFDRKYLYTSLKKKPQITECPCLHCSRIALQQAKVFKGLVEEPCFLKLKEQDQEKGLFSAFTV